MPGLSVGGGGLAEITEENALIREWVAIWADFRANHIQKCIPPSTKTSLMDRRVRKPDKWHRFNTQIIRKEIARNLGVLHGMAFDIARNVDLPLSDRERWTRLAAYIAQTINTVSRSFDSVKIEATLSELEEYVRENVEAG